MGFRMKQRDREVRHASIKKCLTTANKGCCPRGSHLDTCQIGFSKQKINFYHNAGLTCFVKQELFVPRPLPTIRRRAVN